MTDPPARAGRRRRRLWLAGGGGALVLLALVVFVCLFARSISGYADWPPTSDVARDGAAHRVAVASGERFQVWIWGGERAFTCRIVEVESGEPVALRAESGEVERPDGVVSYAARFSGQADGGQVDVTCPAVAQAPPVFIDGLHRPVVVDFLGPWGTLPLALAALGVLLLLSAVASKVRR